MEIHHVGLFTPDLERLKNFYAEHFSATVHDLYEDPAEQLRIHFLSFPNGAKLEVMSKPGLKDLSSEPNKAGYVHLAFSVGSRDEVDRFSSKLEKAGVTMVAPPTLLGDGSYESCFADPDGNLIEIVV